MGIDRPLSRRTLLQGAALLAAARQLGCAASPGVEAKETPERISRNTRPGGREVTSDESLPASTDSASEDTLRSPSSGTAGYDAFACVQNPTAFLLLPSAGAQRLLERAGFRVEALPLDRSPAELRGLIVIPSFASEQEQYADYMAGHAADLYTFVDGANVLIQLAQSAEAEPAPPFLPGSQAAERGEAQIQEVRVHSADHPLLAGVASEDGVLSWTEPSDTTAVFVAQEGFEVVLHDDAGRPLLIEGAYGQGRFVLSALALDANGDAPADDLGALCFANMLEHVKAVCERSAPALSLTISSGEQSFTSGSSMLAVLPDTQFYSLRFPGLYDVQTNWIRMNAKPLDISYAIHLGDIVNNNTHTEWKRASASMALLHGVVPYSLAPGNHDYGPDGNASTRETLMNDYFSFEVSAAMRTFGGVYEPGRLDNSYHLFSMKGRDFVIMSLEWGPRDEVIAWANQVMEQHSEREGILVTHAYLNNNDRRYDHTDTAHSQRFNPHEYKTPGGVNDGEQLWQKLVRRHRFSMTLNGHVLGDGNGYLASVTDHGNVCHQMLSNYQMRPQGGEGYLRLLEFLPDGRTVNVFTYSPLYDRFLDEEHQNFTITLD